MLYATRIVGLLVWIVLVALALKFVQPASRKLALSAVLLLPMFISQASASTDPLINGLIVLFLAMIAGFIVKKVRPSAAQMALLIGIVSLTTLSKPVYIVFALLLFLLPRTFTNWKMVAKTLSLLFIPFVIYGAWSLLTRKSGTFFFDAIAVSRADPSAQIHYVIPNVFNFFEPFMNTLLLNWGDGVYASLIGIFGKLDTPLPLLFVILGYITIFIAVLSSSDDKEMQKQEKKAIVHDTRSKIISALIITGYVVGVYLAMYIASTPPYEKIVTGVQGRYLLPLIPFGVLFATKKYLLFHKRSSYEKLLIILPIIVLVASVIIVYLRYYVVYP